MARVQWNARAKPLTHARRMTTHILDTSGTPLLLQRSLSVVV